MKVVKENMYLWFLNFARKMKTYKSIVLVKHNYTYFVFGNNISNSIYRFDQVNTLIIQFFVFGNLAFSLSF